MKSPGPSLRLVPLESPHGDAAREVHAEVQATIARGEPPSFEALYAEYAPYVAALASRILGRASEVDDVVQDVFALAMHGLRRREDPHQMKGWFGKVTVRLCTRQLRVRRLWSWVDLAADPSYERLADPRVDADERQLVVEVYRALDRLPARERVPWTLRNVEGEQLERVAILCNCSLATAKRRVASAHDKLNRYLGREAP